MVWGLPLDIKILGLAKSPSDVFRKFMTPPITLGSMRDLLLPGLRAIGGTYPRIRKDLKGRTPMNEAARRRADAYVERSAAKAWTTIKAAARMDSAMDPDSAAADMRYLPLAQLKVEGEPSSLFNDPIMDGIVYGYFSTSGKFLGMKCDRWFWHRASGRITRSGYGHVSKHYKVFKEKNPPPRKTGA
jgi:hypothetical protein